MSAQISELASLKYLKKLNLSNNSISTIWDLPPGLEHLNLSGNTIKSVNNITPNLIKLRVLDISNNLLTALPSSFLPNLQNFLASNNKISSLNGLENFPALIELDLESNFVDIQELSILDQNAQVLALNLNKNPIIE